MADGWVWWQTRTGTHCPAGGDDTYGLSSTLPGIIIPVPWIQHDIASTWSPKLNLPPGITWDLEDLWSLAPEEGPPPLPTPAILDDLLAVAGRKLEHDAGA